MCDAGSQGERGRRHNMGVLKCVYLVLMYPPFPLLLPLDKLANHFMKICSFCDYGYSFCPNSKPFISDCFVCCCIVSRFDICVWEMVMEVSDLLSLPSSRMIANYYQQCFMRVLTMSNVLYWPEISVFYRWIGQFWSTIKGLTFQADMRSDHFAVEM